MLHNVQLVTEIDPASLPVKYAGTERRIRQIATVATAERRHPVVATAKYAGAMKVTASLFVSRMLEVGTPTFKMTPVEGGAVPGSDAEYLLQIIVPTKDIAELATKFAGPERRLASSSHVPTGVAERRNVAKPSPQVGNLKQPPAGTETQAKTQFAADQNKTLEQHTDIDPTRLGQKAPADPTRVGLNAPASEVAAQNDEVNREAVARAAVATQKQEGPVPVVPQVQHPLAK